MDDITEIPPLRPSLAYSAIAELTVELAKTLALVAASSMTAAQQELWIRTATESLQEMLPFGIGTICLEVRRKVTRVSQIVPAIAELVEKQKRLQPAERTKDPCRCGLGTKAEGRPELHWTRDNGEMAIGYCEPKEGGGTESA